MDSVVCLFSCTHFLTATSTYGLPSRVRVDHGGENNDICDLMELLRGRGSAIRGTSGTISASNGFG